MSRWYSSETQIRWVCKQLLKGREICHKDEIAAVRGWRLAAVIHVLIKRYHWPIISVRKGIERIAYYSLPKGEASDALEKPRSYHKKKGDAPTSPKNRNK